jgi:GAF domain-containing protein
MLRQVGSDVVLFGGLMENLLEATKASRTTLRVVGVDGSAYLLAERRSDAAVPSMGSGAQVDPRAFPTYTYLEESRSLLVQNDTRVALVAPPPALIEVHRVFAQMLAPVVVEGQFVGTISVHLIDSPREWAEGQIDALRRCRLLVEDVLTLAANCRLGSTGSEPTTEMRKTDA